MRLRTYSAVLFFIPQPLFGMLLSWCLRFQQLPRLPKAHRQWDTVRSTIQSHWWSQHVNRWKNRKRQSTFKYWTSIQTVNTYFNRKQQFTNKYIDTSPLLTESYCNLPIVVIYVNESLSLCSLLAYGVDTLCISTLLKITDKFFSLCAFSCGSCVISNWQDNLAYLLNTEVWTSEYVSSNGHSNSHRWNGERDSEQTNNYVLRID